MKYYVYAIHTDDTSNRPYDKPFANKADAAALEDEMRRGRHPGDNYFVRMFPAENDEEARRIADALRPFPQIRK